MGSDDYSDQGVHRDRGLVRVTGARLHNLRDVSVALPRDAIAAFTGVSGSGKSSLAFGTVYAESQRRYLESVAPYVRRLLHQAEDPDVEELTGMPPAVALSQRRTNPSMRSTVGTLSALGNTLRMLYSRAGDYPEGADRLDSDSFSPNTPAGACPDCEGQGEKYTATEETMVHDPGLSIREGAVTAWPGAWQGKNLRDILATLGYDVDRPWRDLPAADREWILFTDERPVVTVHPEREAHRIQRPYKGTYSSARSIVLKAFAEAKNEKRRDKVRAYLRQEPCPACHGKRLRPEALAVSFDGRDIAEAAALPLTALAEALRPHAGAEGAEGVLVGELLDRLRVLEDLGLGYLSAGRPAPTLSAGELQRLRLGSQLQAGLFGVVYILDEPSAGLHPSDTEALKRVLRDIRRAGNGVFLVEHDLDIVADSDWVVDVGPLAGEKGGEVLYSGPPAGLEGVAGSHTGRYLSGEAPALENRRRAPRGTLALRGVDRHNLRGLDLDLPLGTLTAVTGVSGSGKTTLLGAVADAAGENGDVKRVVTVDQRPIGRTPRSNLATYTNLFDTVRKLFASTGQAKAAGYTASRFSFNVAGGRCETCKGEGYLEVELLFLPSTYTPCTACHGARYNPETLAITYRGKTIADVLGLSVDAAAGFFADEPAAARALRALQDVGLGYLRLGQPATELSGGEAQRVKLAGELQRSPKRTLYLLDEPTTGLHPYDADILTAQLQALVDAGGTVVLAEHDLRVVAAADHVVDLGPGGGDAGGRVIAQGRPEDAASAEDGRTAPYLKEVLDRA
ncbi:ATP-binding cassette domain-containing protein [Salininema proteolyticum]|uniref:UvrABC system protein A n=1 Tax=Salininema proteolyticum TaxID=1607685 RepID=A0ABV8TS89_9ACTN